MWEVSGSGSLLLGDSVLLVSGQSLSLGSGESWQQLSWLSVEAEVSSVGSVELSKLSLGRPGSLNVGSLLLIQDSEGSSDGLSNSLISKLAFF